eukprot:c47339_g1_i1 orf=140-1129(+)
MGSVGADRAVKADIPGLISLHEDGTVVRSTLPSRYLPIPPQSDFVDGVATKDVVIDAETDLSVRIFLPRIEQDRVGVVLYFHAGGFVIGSAATGPYHDICQKLAKRLCVLVVSVSYRVSPEHRLPAAFDDGYRALQWLQLQASSKVGDPVTEPWLNKHANFSSCFLFGHSSGGTIVHHVACRAAAQGDTLSPLKLQGLILGGPFFGSCARTVSEIEYGGESASLTLKLCDALWDFALPEDANRDHPFSNPFSPEAPVPEGIPRCLVIVGGKDLLHDTQIKYTEFLEKAGVEVSLSEFKESDHFVSDMYENEEMDAIANFLHHHNNKKKK